jgi:putative ABC transport system substrate-binding protein
VDAVFTPTDNVIMAAELAIADTFADAKIPHYTGADSFVRNGAFATCGVNYTDLGKRQQILPIRQLQKALAIWMAISDGWRHCHCQYRYCKKLG